MPNDAATRCPASLPARMTCCVCWPPGTPTPRSPGAWASPRRRCAPIWKTSTHGWASPVAPPPSLAPSPTGSLRAHGHREGGVSWSPPSSSPERSSWNRVHAPDHRARLILLTDLLTTDVDNHGCRWTGPRSGDPREQAYLTITDGSGRQESCYGSEGWGFESLRARHRFPGQKLASL